MACVWNPQLVFFVNCFAATFEPVFGFRFWLLNRLLNENDSSFDIFLMQHLDGIIIYEMAPKVQRLWHSSWSRSCGFKSRMVQGFFLFPFFTSRYLPVVCSKQVHREGAMLLFFLKKKMLSCTTWGKPSLRCTEFTKMAFSMTCHVGGDLAGKERHKKPWTVVRAGACGDSIHSSLCQYINSFWAQS